jgi:DNA polymerase-3 subunit alpha
LPGGRGGKYKLPNLTELHAYLFGVPFAEAHNASADVEATARCFFELLRKGNFNTTELGVHADYFAWFAEKNPQPFALWGVKHSNLKAESQKIKAQETPQTQTHQVSQEELALLQQAPFAHLHNHTRFSILQATSEVDKLVQMAIKEEHSAVALTDLGNMMAAFEFVQSVAKQNKKSTHKIKPIVGIELAVCKDRLNKTNKDNGYNIVFLAKNKALFPFLVTNSLSAPRLISNSTIFKCPLDEAYMRAVYPPLSCAFISVELKMSCFCISWISPPPDRCIRLVYPFFPIFFS